MESIENPRVEKYDHYYNAKQVMASAGG
jgi:hypothetical protein